MASFDNIKDLNDYAIKTFFRKTAESFIEQEAGGNMSRQDLVDLTVRELFDGISLDELLRDCPEVLELSLDYQALGGYEESGVVRVSDAVYLAVVNHVENLLQECRGKLKDLVKY